MADENVYVVNSANLERAVANALSGENTRVSVRHGRRPKGRSSLDEAEAPAFAYNGPFAINIDATSKDKKLVVNPGYLNRNGTFKEIGKTTIDSIKTGFICVVCEVNTDNGTWQEPQVKYANPNESSFPIGRTDVSGETVKIVNFCTPVANMIITKQCPLAAANEDK